jgi:hypothetical protein
VLCSSYQFRTLKQWGRSGAIVVLPHGGSSSCIRNAYFQLPEVKRHFREHAPSWYQHALQYMPKKTNGSLILVRATHCARSWGIAAFALKRDIREPLTATFMSNPANEYQHMWQTNDSKWKTSTGPSSEEIRELEGREPPLNQCIGAIVSSLRLDDATWQANFESLSSPSDRGGGWGLRRVMSRDSWSTIRVDNSRKKRLLDSFIGGSTEMRHAGDGSDGMFLSDGSPDLSSIYIDALLQITTFCSKNLNEVILPDMNFDVLAYIAQPWFNRYLCSVHILAFNLSYAINSWMRTRKKRRHVRNVNELTIIQSCMLSIVSLGH